mgnify:CR=1 FL=1
MVYNEKLAVAIKSAGKVLREFKDTVFIPFGSEYSILIKNLNTVRALVKVSIDGQYIDESGNGFIVGANNDIELERFLRNGNLNAGNRFKFIERTDRVEQSRGIGVEDGIVRIEFQYEKPALKPIWSPTLFDHYRHYYDAKDYWTCTNTSAVYGSLQPQGLAQNTGAVGLRAFNSVGASGERVQLSSQTVNDAGITVPGSVSTQRFVSVSGFPVEDTKHVVILRIFGETESGKRVETPVTVKTKQRCSTCRHVNKSGAKFCSECGTALELV